MLAEPVTEKTDVYALGLLGYELVAGSGPFQATTPQELIAAHLRDVPKPLSSVRPDVDPEFERLVAACLDKDPARRPSAAQVTKLLAPGGGVALEWPPPGLESLHGAMRRWSLLLWAGSVLAAGGSLTFALGKPGVTGDGGTTGHLLLALGGALGTVAWVLAASRVLAGLRRASLAVRRGYTWWTALETLADSRGDTGALIAGAREYSTLGDAARNALRRFRVVREALLLAGGALPPLLLLLAVRLASGGALGGAGLAALALGPSALALFAALGLANAESRAVAVQRTALAHRRRRRDDGTRLVEPWYVSFESARGPAGLGRGRAGGDVAGWIGGTAAVLVTLLAVLVLVPLWLVGMMAPRTWSTMMANVSGARAKTQNAELVRRYALPPDPAITPLEAGRAYFVLCEFGRDSAGGGGIGEYPPPARLPPLPRVGDRTLFPMAKGWDGPDDLQILELAMRGFSPAQRRWLEELAAHPVWAAYSTVARAPAMDYLGARFVLPFPAGASVYSLPVPAFAGTKELAYANTVRAAYFLSQGRRAEAERVLRETVSFGLQLVDHGRFAIDALVGVVIAGLGRHALIQYYTLTGRPEASALRDALAAWQARYDSATGADAELARVGRMNPRQIRRYTFALPWDRSLPIGLRMEQVSQAGLAPCTDLQEIVFGPAPDVRDVFARARRDIARFPSDSALIDLMERDAERGPPIDYDVWGPEWARRGPLKALFFGALRGTGRLLGSPRLARCGEFVLGTAMR